MLFFSVVLVFTAAVSALQTIEIVEHQAVDITCSGDYVINIEDAKYGLGNRLITVTKLAEERCNDGQHCTIHASNALAGDPLPGTAKKLFVKYSCTHNGNTAEKTVNGKEHYYSASLECFGFKHVIRVLSAVYGNGWRWNDCRHTVEEICNGLKACSVPAENYLFGDPAQGIKKILRITYKCITQ